MKYALMALAISLGACTAPSQALLNQQTAACGAGDRRACAQLPALNAQVQSENQQNQLATGVAAGVGGLVGGAVIGGAVAGPRYGYGYPGYYGRRCWNCW